jgi:STE24 endopeptidase
MTPRLWATITLAVLLVAAVAVALLRVPLTTPPAPRADQLAALQTLPTDAVARGRAFHSALRPSMYGSIVIGLVAALILGLTPLGAWLVELVGRPFNGHWLAEGLLGGLVVVFAAEVVTLPFAAWRQSVLRRYGLSTQGWSGWTVDLLKGFAVGAVVGAVVLGGYFTITHFAPRWWWAWGAAGAAALTFLFSFVFPVLVEPVFNKFTPMEESPLRSNLIALADRDGVPVRDVLVADASRRTRAVNAYVSGLGPTRRIVVYDTLLREAPDSEVESVVAHELGHAKAGDVVTGTIIGALGAGAAVCALFLLGSWTSLLRRAGVDSIGEPRAVGLLLAVVTVAGLVAGPVSSLMSRHIEARADQHALRLTDDPADFEAMQGRLSLVNLGDPDPNRVEQSLFGTHPTTVERMAIARAWARGAR